jgi:two-component system, cell cycle response regulator
MGSVNQSDLPIRAVLRDNPDVLFSYLDGITRIGLMLISREKVILDCNRALLDLLGIQEKPVKKSVHELLSHRSADFQLPPDDNPLPVKMNFTARDNIQVLLSGLIFRVREAYLIFFEKHMLSYNELIAKMSILNNQLTDLTRDLDKKNRELETANATIQEIMNTDPLTGLLNRRAFREMLNQGMAFSKRHSLPLSLIMTDIDHFKAVNDTYGHEAGDSVLKKFAEVLKESCRTEDTVVRFGGEEFLLLLPNTSAASAAVCAERLRKKTEMLSVPGIIDNITASFGVTEFLITDSEEGLLKRVDDALYVAKRTGRNRCVLK